MQTIRVIDSHTGGEPTRVIVSGGPELGSGTMLERMNRFKAQFDEIRRAVICEPRGNDVLVGALLCEPVSESASAGVIFFNNAGFLGMCGHGTIGLMVTLKHLGRIENGTHTIETPVGRVTAGLENQRVSVQNVNSYRYLADVSVNVPDYGTVIGDVAWGGNWFFLVKDSPERIAVENSDRLTFVTRQIRDALAANQVTGRDGALIDHVELFTAPVDSDNNSRNFVLCPGGAYDRSPCGTGTSAKLACLAADGKLAPGEIWKQESVVGSLFTASYQPGSEPGHIIPTITGSAYVNGDANLILDPQDPFCMGISS